MTLSQTILVTGCSTGLGRTISETLARQGHTVFATMRGVVGKNAAAAGALRQLAQAEGLKLHVVELDVTDDVSVRSAVETALQTVDHLDVVVNNAGIMTVGLSEGLTLTQMRQMFEVNVFGAFRVNQAVLPHMRQQKAGYLVYISSTSADIVFPFMGMYGASKAAFSSLAEAWHYELFSQGIDTTIVQSGGYATELANNSLTDNNPQLTQAYGAVGAMAQMVNQSFPPSLAARGGDPRQMGQLISDLIAKPAGQRPLFAPIGSFSEGITVINQPHEAVQKQVISALQFDSLLTR